MGLEAEREVEMVRGEAGEVAGRIVRQRWPVAGLARVSGEAAGQAVRVRVRIENLGLGYEATGSEDRNHALRHSLVGAHTLLALRDGAFVSLLDPPEWSAGAAASCVNLHTWPVLVGEEGRRDVMLSSPIILCDYPQVAPESPGDLCDATKIDEILTLTDEEKREARGTDVAEGEGTGTPETAYGRFFYFYPDEIEPLDVAAEPPPHHQGRAGP